MGFPSSSATLSRFLIDAMYVWQTWKVLHCRASYHLLFVYVSLWHYRYCCTLASFCTLLSYTVILCYLLKDSEYRAWSLLTCNGSRLTSGEHAPSTENGWWNPIKFVTSMKANVTCVLYKVQGINEVTISKASVGKQIRAVNQQKRRSEVRRSGYINYKDIGWYVMTS